MTTWPSKVWQCFADIECLFSSSVSTHVVNEPGNDVGDEGARALADAIRHRKLLVSLNLAGTLKSMFLRVVFACI